MFQRGVIYEVKEGGGRYISIDGDVMFCSSGRAWIKSAASERDLIYLLGEGVIVPLVENEAIPPIGISDAKVSCEINHENVESWKDGELTRLLGNVIHQSVEDALSEEIAGIVDKLSRQLTQRDAQIAGMEVELSGANGRCKIMFEAKNYWAERARKAEAQVVELDERVIRYAGIATARAEHVAEQEKQIAALTAENVALMQRIDWPMEQCPTTGAVTAVDPADFIPATDAAANALRAEGAEAVAAYHNERVEALSDVHRRGANDHAFAYMAAKDVANKLREGK